MTKSIIYKNKICATLELYDVLKNKWHVIKTSSNPKYLEIKIDLRTQLLKWMEDCGDKGQQTEMAAFEHMLGRICKLQVELLIKQSLLFKKDNRLFVV